MALSPPCLGWIITLIIVAPWCIGIALKSHGAFFKNAVGHNLLGKITHGQESHGFPPGYYAVIFILAFWPGALFTLRALPQYGTTQKFIGSFSFMLDYALLAVF
ncbi:hypothetical protein [Aristophania vespae]|uniref:hypothetical protein n=1 Tax=Aristophania vespae TaxID=2697033 RepID=UPI001F21539D|nr:hypothetical protein [Aristophania vespae]